MAATSAIKDKHQFLARPYPGPLTLALLFSEAALPAAAKTDDRPPWFVEMHSKLGLHERDNNAELRAWLRSDRATVGDPAAIAWCGDGMQTSIALMLPEESIPANPFLAMQWLKFGRPLATTALGAILVFHAGDPSSIYGHVGLYAGEDATTYHVLGANQSNAVTFTRIAKSRLRKGGIRWPSTDPLPTGGPVVGTLTGSISAGERRPPSLSIGTPDPMQITKYSKAIAALVTAAAVAAANGFDLFFDPEVQAGVVALITALVVFLVPNATDDDTPTDATS